MIEAIEARARAAAELRAEAAAARLAERLGTIPGARAEAAGGAVTIHGRALERRIGWTGGWLK